MKKLLALTIGIVISLATYAQTSITPLNISDIEKAIFNRDAFKILMLDNNFTYSKPLVDSSDVYKITFSKDDKTGQDEEYKNDEEKLTMAKLIVGRLTILENKTTEITFAINKTALPKYLEDFVKSIKKHYPNKVLVKSVDGESDRLYYTRPNSKIKVFFSDFNIIYNIVFRYTYQ